MPYKRWELKINEADGYLVSHIWMNPGAPEGVGARYQPLSDSLRSRRSLCETRIHPPRGGPRAWWILRSAQPIAHSSIIIPRFFFHSLRAFRRNELLHTLTLGQALMPAGLPFERRIMRHACGPRRARRLQILRLASRIGAHHHHLRHIVISLIMVIITGVGLSPRRV